MICRHCGTENAEGSAFCTSCGNPFEDNNTNAVNVTSEDGQKEKTAQIQSKMQGTDKFLAWSNYVLIGIGALVLVILIFSFSFGKKVHTPIIDLNQYLKIEAHGYNGQGEAEADVDWAAVSEEYGDDLRFTAEAEEEYGDSLKLISPVEMIRDAVRIKLRGGYNLSNGETVGYEWNVNEDIFKFVDVVLQYYDSQNDEDVYTVTGLEEISSFDPFEDLKVTFEGFAPNGMAVLEYRGNELTVTDFSCDNTYPLSNGDKIEVYLKNDDIQSYAEFLGKIPSEVRKEYIVDGLEEYVGSYSDLTEEFIQKLHSEAEDTIYSYCAGNYDSSSLLSELSYFGYVINRARDVGDNLNNVYVIYTGTVSSSEGNFSTMRVYYPVRFKNVLKSGDIITYEANAGIIGNSNLDGSYYSTAGYVNPYVCYRDIVEANRDNYTAECGDGFEKYSDEKPIEKLQDISEEYKLVLQEEARNKIDSYLAENNDNGPVVTDLGYWGDALLIAKSQGNEYAQNNKYILVFTANIYYSEGQFASATVYYPVEYDGVVKLADEYMVTESKGIQGESYFGESRYYTKGYTDPYKMFSDLITVNRNNYIYEVSDTLKEFDQ